jgi:CPA1 family monovalent cation:H+ antiporter
VDHHQILTIGLLLFTASLVAMLSRRLHLPYSVGLVAAGIALAISPWKPELALSRDLIFEIFLPPLVFEAAMQLPWRAFRRELPLVLLYAFPGVAIAAALVAVGTHSLLGWSWNGAALFGTLIAATDPVAVIAAFKEMRVQPRLSMLVESESLLNDGTAAVGFAILVAIASGAGSSPGQIAGMLLWTVFGGILAGVVVTGGLLLIARRTDDHLVEITLSTIAAYGSFLLAERLEVSGVLASLTAGLMVGNLGPLGVVSDRGRVYLHDFWNYVAFLANSIVFLLIGTNGAGLPLPLFIGAAAVAVVLMLAGRALAIYPLSLLVRRSRVAVNAAYQHVLFWGGLRGALALALALALPTQIAERREIIVVAFAVVAFSIFVQGLSMPWLIRRLGLMRDDRKAAKH